MRIILASFYGFPMLYNKPSKMWILVRLLISCRIFGPPRGGNSPAHASREELSGVKWQGPNKKCMRFLHNPFLVWSLNPRLSSMLGKVPVLENHQRFKRSNSPKLSPLDLFCLWSRHMKSLVLKRNQNKTPSFFSYENNIISSSHFRPSPPQKKQLLYTVFTISTRSFP